MSPSHTTPSGWTAVLPTLQGLADGSQPAHALPAHTEPPALDDSRADAICRLLWAAAATNRDPCAAPASPHRRQAPPADPDGLTRLIQLFGQQQLVALLASATLHALATAKAACSAAPAPAAAPAPHAASKLTRAVLLPPLRLLSTLAMCSRALVSHAHVQELRFRNSRGRQQLQQQLHGGGLIEALTTLSKDLTAALKQQQQQQQQDEDAMAGDAECRQCTQLLSSAVLAMLRVAYVADQPDKGRLWWDSTLGPSVQPAVQLAAALQQAADYTPAAAPAAAPGAGAGSGLGAGKAAAPGAEASIGAAAVSDGSDGSSSSWFDAWLELWQQEFPGSHEPLAFTHILTQAAMRGWAAQGCQMVPPLPEVLGMPEMQQLVCVFAAASAQHLHHLNGGRSPEVPAAGSSSGSSRSSNGAGGGGCSGCAGCNSCNQQQGQGRLEVPPWHEQVYAACGLAAASDLTPVLAAWGCDHPSLPALNVLTLMSQMDEGRFWAPNTHEGGRRICLAAPLAAVRTQLQQKLQQSEQQGGVCAVSFLRQPQLRSALLRVLVGTLLLFPRLKVGVLTLKLASQLGLKGWCYDAAVPVADPAGIALEASSATGELLPLVLQSLGPALTHLLSGGEADPDMTPELSDLLGGYYAQLVAICTWADALAGAPQLQAALQQDEQQQCGVALRSLEASIRLGTMWHRRSMTVKVPAVIGKICGFFKDASSSPATAAAALSLAGLSNNGSSSSGSSGAELFTLLLSALKSTAAVAAQEAPAAEAGDSLAQAALLKSAHTSESVLGLVLSLHGLSEQGSSEAGAAGQAVLQLQQQRRWLWLAGRALADSALACQLMQRVCLGAGMASQDLHSEAQVLITQAMALTYKSVLMLLEHAAGAIPPPVLDQHGVLQIKDYCSGVAVMMSANIGHDRYEDQPSINPTNREGLLSQTGTYIQNCLDRQRAGEGEARMLPRMLRQVLDAGRLACCALPMPYCCNNTRCMRLQGLSEAAAVKGGKCGACRVAQYCGVGCQREGRADHKATCNRIKDTAGAAKACLAGA